MARGVEVIRPGRACEPHEVVVGVADAGGRAIGVEDEKPRMRASQHPALSIEVESVHMVKRGC